jgi:hypothetical protein
MTKNAQRLSQVVSSFGPGAMVDLPTRSVVIGGLELWEMRAGSFTPIPELRLTARLEQFLKAQNRLPSTTNLSLRTPPIDHGRPGQLPNYIIAPVFPAYFVCEQVEIGAAGSGAARRRRLVRWQDLDTRGGRRKFVFDDGKKSDQRRSRRSHCRMRMWETAFVADVVPTGVAWRLSRRAAVAPRPGSE